MNPTIILGQVRADALELTAGRENLLEIRKNHVLEMMTIHATTTTTTTAMSYKKSLFKTLFCFQYIKHL